MDNLLTLNEAKNYLRIDYDDDDLLLQSLLVATMDYLRDSIDNFDKKLKKKNLKVELKYLLVCYYKTGMITGNTLKVKILVIR